MSAAFPRLDGWDFSAPLASNVRAAHRGEMSTHAEHFRRFARYNSRFNEQVFDVIEGISDQERRKHRGAFFGSIYNTLNHILLADRIWLARFRNSGVGVGLEGASLIDVVAGVTLKTELFSEWADLRRERRATDAVIEGWVAGLSSDNLAGPLRYTNFAGLPREHAAWIALSHLFNHQTHHRGQVTTLVSQAGLDPGVTDFLVFALAED